MAWTGHDTDTNIVTAKISPTLNDDLSQHVMTPPSHKKPSDCATCVQFHLVLVQERRIRMYLKHYGKYLFGTLLARKRLSCAFKLVCCLAHVLQLAFKLCNML